MCQFEYPIYKTFDDLLNSTYKKILSNGSEVAAKRGKIKEYIDFAVTLINPRSRISRSLDRRLVRSKFAEFAWYLSGDSKKDYIEPYISAYGKEDSSNGRILGGYGPRIFNGNEESKSQFQRICDQINERKNTKQAYLAISNQSDYKLRTEKFSSPPCTIGLHFLVRNEKLNLTTYMRSNDAYLGLPHDLFCFTMLQEVVSYVLGVPLGIYSHVCTSMHIYECHLNSIHKYLDEGYFEDISMPKMKYFDEKVRNTVVKSYDINISDIEVSHLDSYWKDYTLFSKEYDNNEKWLNKFKDDSFREIANCSISI